MSKSFELLKEPTERDREVARMTALAIRLNLEGRAARAKSPQLKRAYMRAANDIRCGFYSPIFLEDL